MFKTLEFSFLPFLIKLKFLNQSQTAIYIQVFDVLYTNMDKHIAYLGTFFILFVYIDIF